MSYNMGDTSWASLPKQMTRATLEAVAKGDSLICPDRKTVVSPSCSTEENPLLLGHGKLAFFLSALRKNLSDEYPISISNQRNSDFR